MRSAIRWFKCKLKPPKKAVKCLKLFLQANNVEDTDFFTYSDEDLDQWLAKFYWGTCTEKGEKYSSSTMHTIRYGLNRALQKAGKSFEITKKEYKTFLHSINSFENVLKDLKKSGKGTVRNTPEISATHNFSPNTYTKLIFNTVNKYFNQFFVNEKPRNTQNLM